MTEQTADHITVDGKDIPIEEIYVTARGVVLHVNSVSAFIIKEQSDTIKYPDVPKRWDEEKQRDIENPGDLAYLEEWSNVEKERAALAMNSCLAMGVKVLSIPDDVPGPDSKEWSDPLEDPDVMLSHPMVIPTDGRARWLAWMKYIACSNTDYTSIVNKTQELGGGVRADVVQKALASFSGGDTGIRYIGVATKPATNNGQQRRSGNISTNRRSSK